jgi:hypothetical protein
MHMYSPASRDARKTAKLRRPRGAKTPHVGTESWNRLAGNQALQRLLQAHAIQAKLHMSQPNDPFEQEADRIAHQVMHMPAREQATPCAACASGASPCPKCSDRESVRIASKTGAASSDHAVSTDNEHLALGLGQGRPLDAAARAYFEPRFGYDFSAVRVYTDANAAASAQSLNALAYTAGHRVVFGAGRYAPQGSVGRALLAHELTHVMQQSPRSVRQNNKFASGLRYRSAAAEVGAAKSSGAGSALIQRQTDESSGPSGFVEKARYLAQDVGNLFSRGRWSGARSCLEGLFPSMRSVTFDRWIPQACGRSRSGFLHSREWDAFGHCWIGCEGTRQCGGPQTWVYGFGRELSREWERLTGGAPHDSFRQDSTNQLLGRALSVQAGTCFSICDNAHRQGLLDLSAPQRACANCATYPASGSDGPCPQ